MTIESAIRLQKLRAELERLHENPTKEAIRDLEEKARTLRRDTISGDLEDDAREFLGEVSNLRRQQSNNSNGAANSTSIVDDLRAAETRIVSGAIADLREAVRLLDHVLQQDPRNEEAYRLLAQLIEKPGMPRNDVEELLNSVNTPEAKRLLRDLQSSASNSQALSPPSGNATYQDPHNFSSGGGSSSAFNNEEIERLQQRMIDAYYQGDYKETVKICVAILNLDPHNGPAKEYQAKAEDYIQRGVVPDHRIPLNARISFNRGVSSMRAGIYEQARESFETAIRTARVEGGVERWMDAENALLEIENLAMAKDLRSEGDKLAQEDQWEEALEKYEGALALVDEPRSRGKHEAVKRVLKLYQQIGVQMELLSGRLVNQAKDLQELRKTLREAREHLPESPKLSRLVALMDSRTATLNDELQKQGQNLVQQAQRSFTLQDRIRLLEQAKTYLETARDLLPAGDDISHLEIQADLDRAKQAVDIMGLAERSLNVRNPSSLDETRGYLRTISDDLAEYVQDPRYRNLLTKLQRYLLENVEAELGEQEPDLDRVCTQLRTVKEAPFNVLGPSSEVRHLENKLRKLEEKAHRAVVQQRVKIALTGIGGVVVLLIFGLLTRGIWGPILNPTPTLTPTITPTATITPTPTNTPTPTLTPTPTPTKATDLCLGITRAASSYYVREEPDINSTRLGTAPPERSVRILDQTRDKEGVLWYKIDYGASNMIQQGWIMAKYIIEVTECPRLD